MKVLFHYYRSFYFTLCRPALQLLTLIPKQNWYKSSILQYSPVSFSIFTWFRASGFASFTLTTKVCSFSLLNFAKNQVTEFDRTFLLSDFLFLCGNGKYTKKINFQTFFIERNYKPRKVGQARPSFRTVKTWFFSTNIFTWCVIFKKIQLLLLLMNRVCYYVL